MKTLKYIAIVALASAFTSCSSSDDSVDTEKPVIVLNAPEEGAKLEAGKDVHFDMEVSDNEALGSYNVDIHNDFDGHTHGIVAMAEDHDHEDENEHRTPFQFNKTWDNIYGKKNDDVHHHEIIIPADAKRGKYHFVVKVLDKAGNQEMVYRNIEIVDPGEGNSDHDHDHDHDHE